MNKKFFIATLSIIMATCCVSFDNANAAPRTAVRGAPAAAGARKSVATTTQKVETTAPVVEEKSEPVVEEKEEVIVLNKSSEFEIAMSNVLESASEDNSFAEQIRKQRAAFATADATNSAQSAQKNALANNSNTCDRDLRKCMQKKCGNDFTECALDGDTIFGDKLNACRRDTTCTGEEFNLFVPEIRADRDMNVRLASYERVIACGNNYNACIVNECGKTYNKCLGKAQADAAIQKCATIAKECTESDSGLANRFGTAIGKLRESAETEVKRDEERMYKLRDLMSSECKKLGAMFDERTFDCVYTVNFFAGENQTNPTASRKRYAGDTFVCMQEWFGINATTFQENAFRETRAQTAASSAMLGSGVGSAVGMITSGAIDRAVQTQKAKKELKKEEKAQKKAEKEAQEAANQSIPGAEEIPQSSKSNGSGDGKNDAQKLADNVKSKDINDVKKENVHNDLSAARKKGEQAVTGDTRTYQQKAADKAVGDHSLKGSAPKPLDFSSSKGSSTGTGSTSITTSSATPTKLSTPSLTSGVGFKASTPSLPKPSLGGK